MGEDALQVELPKATGEGSGSRIPRARPVPLYDRIEPLRPLQNPELDYHRRLFEAFRQNHMWDQGPGIQAVPQFHWHHLVPEIPEVHLPQPRPNEYQLAPLQLREGGLRQQHEDMRVQQRHVVQQQRVLTGKSAGGGLGNPRPAPLPDNPTHPVPRRRRNRAGGLMVDPVDRGNLDQWQRGVPGPRDPEGGAAL